MSLDSTLRQQSTQDAILRSIVDRLIDQIEELTEDSCWLSDQPIPISMPGGRFAVTVSIGGGRFPAEFFTGGGADTLTEDGSIIVTPLVVITGDRPRRKWKKIAGRNPADTTPNLLYFKRSILKALLGDEQWEPSTDDQPLLRDMLAPLHCDDPRDVPVGETVAAAMKMTFSTVFDWDLS